MSKAIKLTKDPIWELLRKVTIPASVGSLFQTFYNLVDTWFAGRISAEAIGAIAKSFPIYFVIIAVGVGIGAATNSCIGNLLGAKKINKASLFIAQSVIFSLVTSIVVTLFGLNASDFLLSVMGSDAAGIALTREYLDIIFYGTFIVMIQISLNGALNAQGDTKSYRNVLIFSFFLNIFLNPLFIWGYGIVPAYGIGGLAIATVIAQSIGTIYLAYKINSCKLRKYLSIKCFIPKFILLKELFTQAMPIMISMLFIGVGIFNILYFIGQFGDLATAGYGAALRVEQVFLLPVIGLNTAVLSIGGQNFGAKNYNRIRELYTKALFFGSSFMAVAGVVLFFGAEFFVSQFTDNVEAIYHGAIYLKVAALIAPIYPVFFITTAVFQALKKPIYSLYLSVLRLTAFPFLSLWYVINIRGGDYADIFYTIMATNWFMGIAVIIFIGYFLNNVFKQKKVIFLISVSVLIFILTINQVKSQTIKIVDGDTIHLNGEKIRFTGIDTPELKQTCLNEGAKDPCGITAKQILIDKISNNSVECISEGKDQYKRTLAECFVNNESLSSYLVRSGYAFAYRRYSKKFVSDEDYARINKIGMWSMEFDYPWDYRKSKKN